MKNLVECAIDARESAYAPYSSHPVGATIISESGRYFSGCNVENAAFPEGLCAEASAISAMVLAGDRKIKAIAIAGPDGQPCPPCGGCRQKIREFACPDTAVYVITQNGTRKKLNLSELLPESFGPDNLAG